MSLPIQTKSERSATASSASVGTSTAAGESVVLSEGSHTIDVGRISSKVNTPSLASLKAAYAPATPKRFEKLMVELGSVMSSTRTPPTAAPALQGNDS